MSDATKAFDFSQFVPGFDFLKNLAKPAGSGVSAVPGMPSLSSWVAPTLSVEEVDKRITELKAVQYWLEQNGHALKATIQALEVQKMTLSTLRGMNVRMEDLANAFTRTATIVTTPPAPAPKPAPAPVAAPAPQVEEPEPAPEEDEVADNPEAAPVKAKAAGKSAAEAAVAAGVIDPLQWWSALTQQFQQIATTAMQDAAKLGAPPGGSGTSSATKKGASDAGAAGAAAKKAAKKPARKAASKKAAKAAVRRR